MQICPKCNTPVEEDAIFCSACGNKIQVGGPVYAAPASMYDPYDHTSEFDAKDISNNKVYAMSVYLLGWIGIIIALLAAQKSDYAAFHVRQALKFTIVQTLLALVAAVTFFTIIIPIAAGVMTLALTVIEVICFFQVCAGKAKEPVIIKNLTFLR